MREIDEGHWWDERLDAWSQEGFNVNSFRESLLAEPDSASEMLMEFNSLISKNRILRRRVIGSTMTRVAKNGWLSRLDDVGNTESILKEWNEHAANNRPWEPYVHRAEDRWSERGKRRNLSAIVKRLDALDPSSYPACQPLFILFDDVSSESIISSMIDDIEGDEAKRRSIVDDMVNLLHRDGIDASEAKSMNINDALNHLSSLQSKADKARNNRLRIEKEIRPYDEELANRLIEKNSNNLTEEVDAIIDNLSERLSSLTSTIEEWKHLGVKFPDGGEIQPHDLLDWEAGLPEIESAVEIHLRALERWKDFATLWPDKCRDGSLVGRLDKTEEFVDLVDSLDQEWRALELEGMQIIGSWEDKGFAMDVWRSRISEEPRSTIAWLKREEANYQKAYSMIESLLSIDASIEGEEEIAYKVSSLREFDLEAALLLEVEDFIERKVRRTARHRSMLEMDWMDLVRKGLTEDRPTASLSIAEFENLISDARTNKRNSGIPIERLESRMQEEIDEWYENGFSVDVLKDMLQDNPVDLALRITSMREAVAEHEKLRRRVSGLDWTRDPKMSIEVNLELSMPDRLNSLSSRISQMMMDLAQKSVEDPDFKFVAWRPRRRSRPTLVPIPRNTVEDAMEAILEEMESEEAGLISEAESTLSSESDDELEDEMTEQIETDEESEFDNDEDSCEQSQEVSEKKRGKVGSLFRGGGKDGVGNFGAVGDLIGGITDRIGVTNYGLSGKSKRDKKNDEEGSEDIITSDFTSIESLLRALGLEDEANMLADNGDINSVRRALASHVGIEPRDMRLDRLLRLSLRLMPKGDEHDGQRYALLTTLGELANILSKWTRTRLEARHSGAIGNLLEDSVTLGEALSRIPGPGTPIPLVGDEFNLPALEDINGLSNEVSVLKQRIMLTNSGGVR